MHSDVNNARNTHNANLTGMRLHAARTSEDLPALDGCCKMRIFPLMKLTDNFPDKRAGFIKTSHTVFGPHGPFVDGNLFPFIKTMDLIRASSQVDCCSRCLGALLRRLNHQKKHLLYMSHTTVCFTFTKTDFLYSLVDSAHSIGGEKRDFNLLSIH